jgi:hypothetical protein
MPWGRRELLWATGSLAATVAAKTARATGAGQVTVGDLWPGQELGPCRLVHVLPVERGALPFVLADPSGVRFVVELHVHDPSVRSLARAGSYDVFLRNGGTGDTPTDEAHGLGAMALAAVVAAREASGRPIPPLATIVERWASDPPPTFR